MTSTKSEDNDTVHGFLQTNGGAYGHEETYFNLANFNGFNDLVSGICPMSMHQITFDHADPFGLFTGVSAAIHNDEFFRTSQLGEPLMLPMESRPPKRKPRKKEKIPEAMKMMMGTMSPLGEITWGGPQKPPQVPPVIPTVGVISGPVGEPIIPAIGVGVISGSVREHKCKGSRCVMCKLHGMKVAGICEHMKRKDVCKECHDLGRTVPHFCEHRKNRWSCLTCFDMGRKVPRVCTMHRKQKPCATCHLIKQINDQIAAAPKEVDGETDTRPQMVGMAAAAAEPSVLQPAIPEYPPCPQYQQSHAPTMSVNGSGTRLVEPSLAGLGSFVVSDLATDHLDFPELSLEGIGFPLD